MVFCSFMVSVKFYLSLSNFPLSCVLNSYFSLGEVLGNLSEAGQIVEIGANLYMARCRFHIAFICYLS